jgi:hypothetical protein
MKATPTIGEQRPWATTAIFTSLVVVSACAVAAALRLGAWIPNVTAVGALALYAGGRTRWWLAWLPPLAVMAVTDLLLARWYGYPMFNTAVYACFLIDVLLGRALARGSSPVRIGLAGFLGALQFYLITNFAEWLAPIDPLVLKYPQTAAGLVQCYVMALPFFGYTLLGNLAFSAAFFGADALLTQAAPVAKAEEVRS